MFNNTKTLKIVDFPVSFDISKIDTLHCVYTHSVEYAEGVKIMYVGNCLLKFVMNANDARLNRAWREHIGSLDNVTLTIIAVCEHSYEAFAEMTRISTLHRPYCNVHGEREKTRGSIRCVQDDKVFSNASKAARFYGISQSALSNHLNGRVGYKSVHKLTFVRE